MEYEIWNIKYGILDMDRSRSERLPAVSGNHTSRAAPIHA
jgi:hypothetical protein